MAYLETGIWATEVAGNTLGEYVNALGVFIIAVVVLKIVKTVIISRIAGVVERSKTKVDDALVEIFQSVRPPFYIFLAFYGATRLLTLTGLPQRVLTVILLVWVTWQVIAAFIVLIDHIVLQPMARAKDVGHQAVSGIIGGLTKILLWVIGILFVLSNLGVNINSLLAGIGIGGLAIALAARSLLEDLFSSLAIYFDRPFAPGDFIEIGSDKGTVQKIGIKTTRIRALSGEEVVIPNKDLTSSRIRNFKRMQERRVAFNVVIGPEADSAAVHKVPQLVQTIIEGQEGTRFKWVYLVALEGDKKRFEVVYFVATQDYTEYLETQQNILFGIQEALSAEGITLA